MATVETVNFHPFPATLDLRCKLVLHLSCTPPPGKLKFSVAGGSSFSAVRKVFAGRVPSFIVNDDLAPTPPLHNPHRLPPTSEEQPAPAAALPPQTESHPQPPASTSPPPPPSTTTSDSTPPPAAANIVSQPSNHLPGIATCCSAVLSETPIQVNSSSSGGGGSSCDTSTVPSPQETDSGSSSSGGGGLAGTESRSSSDSLLRADEVSNSHQAQVIMQRVAAEGERRHASSKPEQSLLKKLMQYCSQPPSPPATPAQTLAPSLPFTSAAAAVAGSDGAAASAGAGGSSGAQNGGGGSGEPHALQHPRSVWMRTHLADPSVNFAVLAKVR